MTHKWFLLTSALSGWVILSVNSRWIEDEKSSLLGVKLQSAINRIEAERAELDAVLASEVLGRSNNLVRLLSFVCEKYFDGSIGEIKEYSIAVEALGRPENFDPQVDTIVRVTAHALRKRLEEYYRAAGLQHSVHICLPSGHYVPKFIHKGDQASADRADSQKTNGRQSQSSIRENTFSGNGHHESVTDSTAGESGELSLPVGHGKRALFHQRALAIAVVLVLAAAALSSFIWYELRDNGSQSRLPVAASTTSFLGSAQTIRAFAGKNGAPYVDRAGATWESDQFCTGGDSFIVPERIIQGTEDAQLFSSGRRGTFRCSYPVLPGTYEVHLLFAETAGLLENSRNVSFSINGGPATTLDVVDDAGGNDIATTKVFTDIKPEDDGAIHVDFTTPDSFLNAIEILPGIPHRMLPVRILSGPSLYRDSNGNTWMPDRYFFGGRVNRLGSDLSRLPEGRLLEWHRYGHFHYTVPVAPGGRYTLKLYFLEHWFGVQNGSVGGVGSRVFDVSCNGSMLLKNFDIYREAGATPLTKTFDHIEPTPQGKIEIYFTPSLNYPSVSAVEILAE